MNSLLFQIHLDPDEKGVITPKLRNAFGKPVTLDQILKSFKNNGWMVQGCSVTNHVLAEALGVSPRTIENLLQGRDASLEVLFRAQALCRKIGGLAKAAEKKSRKGGGV